MAELADAHGSGPCEGNFMQVQVLLSAPKSTKHFNGFVDFTFYVICNTYHTSFSKQTATESLNLQALCGTIIK